MTCPDCGVDHHAGEHAAQAEVIAEAIVAEAEVYAEVRETQAEAEADMRQAELDAQVEQTEIRAAAEVEIATVQAEAAVEIAEAQAGAQLAEAEVIAEVLANTEPAEPVDADGAEAEVIAEGTPVDAEVTDDGVVEVSIPPQVREDDDRPPAPTTKSVSAFRAHRMRR